jgi:2-polyprenyl-3-methyl-5-hydroxy-6-metoxy-1,4-benzoquinol methylase
MSPAVQTRLLELNRRFYATVAGEFDRTRQGLPSGMLDLAARLAQHVAAFSAADLAAVPGAESACPVRVLDVGCGNGRFARALAAAGLAGERTRIEYFGVDADAQLLAAAEQTADLAGVTTRFVTLDIADPAWPQLLGAAPFDVVVCLAVLHHFPGYSLRQRLVADLRDLLAPGGMLALSTWQFLTAARLADKQADWAEVGIDPADLEPGDALLPWNQGAHALRYVHQLDLAEVQALAGDALLQVAETFRADGKEGNLNLYALLRP